MKLPTENLAYFNLFLFVLSRNAFHSEKIIKNLPHFAFHL
ncbi:hypothetical protein HMPREF9953_1295 [Haemophilus parainfluenzae ATCC 33392]|nr:hypothetical protein HMPREF9417_0444 [Haemophilus parainfluenzae ATCC 33392]KFL99455.1 hypothetical protein HMPREF9953_1295 [Haemophilus parainfluenzae ATCC 33392]